MNQITPASLRYPLSVFNKNSTLEISIYCDAETGIPPLYITQNLQLTQLRFRLHSSPPATIQLFLWQLWQPLLQLVPLNTLETRIQTAVCHVDMAHRDPASPLPQNVNMAKILNKEKSYKKYHESQCSDQW